MGLSGLNSVTILRVGANMAGAQGSTHIHQLMRFRGKAILLPLSGQLFVRAVLVDFDEPSTFATNFLED